MILHSFNEDEIEDILSPPYIPYSPPDFPSYDNEHTSSVQKLRRYLEPRSDSDDDSDCDIESIEESKLISDHRSSSSSSSSHLSIFIPRTVHMATSTRQSPPWLIDSGALPLALVQTVTSPTVSTVTSRSQLRSDSSSVQLQKVPSTILSSVRWASEFTDTFKPWLPSSSTTDVLSLIHITGDKDLQHRLRTSCKEFEDILSNELPAAPAKIPEFHLTVKDSERKVAQKRAPPRAQNPKKQAALFTTIETLLRQGIIRKSTSPHYSQVLLVPKADNTFRRCVDYRALNDCTPDASWPIPNIAKMLLRIGSRKPKIFGIMDLTQGYHQAPLSNTTKAYTAFITFSGVYEFTRTFKKSWPL